MNEWTDRRRLIVEKEYCALGERCDLCLCFWVSLLGCTRAVVVPSVFTWWQHVDVVSRLVVTAPEPTQEKSDGGSASDQSRSRARSLLNLKPLHVHLYCICPRSKSKNVCTTIQYKTLCRAKFNQQQKIFQKVNICNNLTQICGGKIIVTFINLLLHSFFFSSKWSLCVKPQY